MMPLHETLRATGQGMLCGSLIATPTTLGAFYFGFVGFLVAGAATGAALITIANALKRRAQRKAKDWI